MNSRESGVNEHIALVNSQIQYHKYQAERSEEAFKQEKHAKLVKQFESLLEYLENSQSGDPKRGQNRIPPISPPKTISLPKKRMEELTDLPEELVSQLKGIVTYNEKEKVILEIIRENNGSASIDEVLIGIYRKTGEIDNRDKLSRKLYNMYHKKGILSLVPKRKGIYQINPNHK